MPRVLSVSIFLVLGAPALALTGNAPPAAGWAARPIVMIVDTRDDLCTGTALARDLVLTAAHCLARLHAAFFECDPCLRRRQKFSQGPG
jgi:hypothetical protein